MMRARLRNPVFKFFLCSERSELKQCITMSLSTIQKNPSHVVQVWDFQF